MLTFLLVLANMGAAALFALVAILLFRPARGRFFNPRLGFARQAKHQAV